MVVKEEGHRSILCSSGTFYLVGVMVTCMHYHETAYTSILCISLHVNYIIKST